MAVDFGSSYISCVWKPACISKITALNRVPGQCDRVDALLGQGPVAERTQVNKISAK